MARPKKVIQEEIAADMAELEVAVEEEAVIIGEVHAQRPADAVYVGVHPITGEPVYV